MLSPCVNPHLLDAPPNMAPPEWLAYLAIEESRASKDHQVQPYRFAESAPAPHSLRVALDNEGFVYQFAAAAAASIFL